VGAVQRGVEPDRADPAVHQARVVAGGDRLAAAADPAREEVVPWLAATLADPPRDRVAGLLGQLELYRTASLALQHRGARPDAPA
jgi:precorrin-6B methylase 1